MCTFILRLLSVSILASLMAWAAPIALPYRFLLVISDQWKDDASLVIQRPNDFQFLAALLKTWGLPFDILRLDQQRLDRYHLLDRDGRPLYGTILWNTGAAKVPDQDLEVLEGLVAQGTSVVMVADAVTNPRLAALACYAELGITGQSGKWQSGRWKCFFTYCWAQRSRRWPTLGRAVEGGSSAVVWPRWGLPG